MSKKGRPGILLYFDTVEPLLTQLSDDQVGQLFRAVFEYGHYGVVPSFPAGILAMAWAMLKPAIDRDSENYNDKVLQREYAVYVRECKRSQKEYISFEKFKKHRPISKTSTDNDRHQPITDDIENIEPYPIQYNHNTTPTTTTTNKGDRRSQVPQILDEEEFGFVEQEKSVVRGSIAELEDGGEYENDLPF